MFSETSWPSGRDSRFSRDFYVSKHIVFETIVHRMGYKRSASPTLSVLVLQSICINAKIRAYNTQMCKVGRFYSFNSGFKLANMTTGSPTMSYALN